MEELAVVNTTAASRYELETAAGPAVLEYVRDGKRLSLVHTGVPKTVAGRGLGTRLVKAALEDARTHGLRVEPLCGFARAFISRHPEYAELVAKP